jgi:GTPase
MPFLYCLMDLLHVLFRRILRLVGTLAREKLEDFFQSQVYLQLNVKVEKDWRRREDRLKEYGYLKSK